MEEEEKGVCWGPAGAATASMTGRDNETCTLQEAGHTRSKKINNNNNHKQQQEGHMQRGRHKDRRTTYQLVNTQSARVTQPDGTCRQSERITAASFFPLVSPSLSTGLQSAPSVSLAAAVID